MVIIKKTLFTDDEAAQSSSRPATTQASADVAAEAAMPSVSGGNPRQRRKDARPLELIEAAQALFVERGFSNTKIEDIAAMAGVSKGTVYLYYASKEELLKAVIDHALGAKLAEGRGIIDAFDGPTPELLAIAVQFWWERTGTTLAGGICKLVASEAGNFPELGVFFMEQVALPGYQLLAEVVKRGIARGEFRAVDADKTARLIAAPIIYMTIHRHSLGACPGVTDIFSPDQLIRAHIDMLLHGLLR